MLRANNHILHYSPKQKSAAATPQIQEYLLFFSNILSIKQIITI